mgnify:CR=1 FL=1
MKPQAFHIKSNLPNIKHYLSKTITKEFNYRAMILNSKTSPLKPNYNMITVHSEYYFKKHFISGKYQAINEIMFYLN